MNQQNEAPSILIVDDKPANLQLLETILKSSGFAVRVANSGRVALRSMERIVPDLLLLDINMPEMNGYEVCTQVRQTTTTKDIPIIFMSANSDHSDIMKGFEVGASDYITKPFRNEEVLARVNTHMENQSMKRELKEKYEQLQVRDHLKEDLTHMVVHDLRSPLQTIRGYLQLVLSGESALSDSDRKYLGKVLTSSDTLNEMVTDLLDISRFEQNSMPLHKAVFDMREIAQEVIEGLGVVVTDYVFRYYPPENAVFVECDPGIMRRIIANLLGNAFKFTPENAEVTLTIHADNDCVKVDVCDAGRGIPEESKDRIFEKFGQVEMHTEGVKYSTGLGLTFCKMAVDAHEGEMGVESELGQGSTFWFTLPAAAQNMNELDPREAVPASSHSKQVLVVDKDSSGASIQTLLEKEGYTVDTAPDAKTTLKMLENSTYHLVIGEMIMPDKNGMEVMMDLRREFKFIPVITLSNGSTDTDMHIREVSSLLGAKATVAKTAEADVLLDTVRSVLNKSKPLSVRA